MNSRAADTFEEWLATPMASESADPRFEVRRAELADFEQIFDVVDDAFGVKRPRAEYDWLYRKSPLGPARCWVVVEKQTGAIVNASGRLPWPLARGTNLIEGALLADTATVRRWQRQGLGALRRPSRRGDPWRQRSTVFGWPNAKARARAAKRGEAKWNFGPLPRWVLPLRTSGHLQRRYGLPAPLAAAAGAGVDLALRLARATAREGRRVHVAEMSRFDASFDAVTWAGMAAPVFWSPHDSEFLNWRYGANPSHEYACAAASEGGDPCGYAVVRLGPGRAVLMELVSSAAPDVSQALIRWAARIARAAGCPQLDFEATCSEPYAAVLKRAGFIAAPSEVYLIAAPSEVYLTAHVAREAPERTGLEDWRLVPGDQDSL